MKAPRNESFDKIKITETWAKSLLKCTGYVRRTKTSSTVEILDGARKEIEYQYLFLKSFSLSANPTHYSNS